MKQIGDGECAAGVASACRVKGAFIVAVRAATQIASAHRGESDALFGERGGQNAIEHVDATMHCFEYVPRRAHSHQIAWSILRQQLGPHRSTVLTLRGSFTN